MTNLPKNLPALLRSAGLTVIEIDGWETRGRPASTGAFNPVGALNHHTGASAKSWDAARRLAYARWMFLTGRSDLPAPLCQLSLGPDGEVYLGASGRANHAGEAKASGSVAAGDGNTLYVGIEWMLSGTETIPAKMYAAGATLNAVLLDYLGSSTEAVSCHYNTSVTGKWDIGDPKGIDFKGSKVLDVPKFRKAVAKELARLDKPKPVPSQAKLVALTANIASKKRVPELITAIDRRQPDVVICTEAYHARKFLRSIPGYKLAQYTKRYGPEAPGIAVLARKDSEIKNRRLLRMTLPWTGPLAGRKHKPRRYPSLIVKVDDVLWRVLGLHFPTHNNPSAQAESMSRTISWFDGSKRPSVALGDWNKTDAEVETAIKGHSLQLAAGTKVDHAVFDNAQHESTVRLSAVQPAGMHGWIVYTFTN